MISVCLVICSRMSWPTLREYLSLVIWSTIVLSKAKFNPCDPWWVCLDLLEPDGTPFIDIWLTYYHVRMTPVPNTDGDVTFKWRIVDLSFVIDLKTYVPGLLTLDHWFTHGALPNLWSWFQAYCCHISLFMWTKAFRGKKTGSFLISFSVQYCNLVCLCVKISS